MADQRLKGQEVEILITDKGVIKDTITDVRSLELAFKFDLLQEGYLGETTDRYDEIFRGVRGNMELHVENQDFLSFIIDIVNRARRREPGTKINIKTTLNFPNGQTPRLAFNDVFFEEIPLSFGSRSDYGALRLSFAASTPQVIS